MPSTNDAATISGLDHIFTTHSHPMKGGELSKELLMGRTVRTLTFYETDETKAVYTVPSFSYNRPVQLKHAHNHDLTRVFIQVMNINILSNTHMKTQIRVINKPSPLNTYLVLATLGID
ncbi:hypothetical protein ACTXT7_008543 [Hymenolepis weldensis]